MRLKQYYDVSYTEAIYYVKDQVFYFNFNEDNSAIVRVFLLKDYYKIDPDNKMETYEFGIIYIKDEDKFQMQDINSAFNFIPDETNKSMLYTKEYYEKFDSMLKDIDDEYRTTLINFAKYKSTSIMEVLLRIGSVHEYISALFKKLSIGNEVTFAVFKPNEIEQSLVFSSQLPANDFRRITVPKSIVMFSFDHFADILSNAMFLGQFWSFLCSHNKSSFLRLNY